MRRSVRYLAAAVISVACDSPTAVVGVQPPPRVTAPVVGTSFRLSLDTIGLIAGESRRLSVEAQDRNGSPLSTDVATVTSSDPSVVQVSTSTVDTIRYSTTPVTWRELSQMLSFVAPGRAFVRVTLGNVSDSLLVIVLPHPRASTALVVDSFSVVEYRVQCAWDCPYLAYAPLLKLRESTGLHPAEVVSVQFTLGSHTTGVCRGSVVYAPGTSAQLNKIDDYLWNNDLIFVNLDGQPLPGDIATARVIVRDADGTYSEINATGPVQRMVAHPNLPEPQANEPGWSCN